jgi:hypothetical protein
MNKMKRKKWGNENRRRGSVGKITPPEKGKFFVVME